MVSIWLSSTRAPRVRLPGLSSIGSLVVALTMLVQPFRPKAKMNSTIGNKTRNIRSGPQTIVDRLNHKGKIASVNVLHGCERSEERRVGKECSAAWRTA